ncbi:MAG: glycoside hydrolase family 43 protein [Clostridia bacterium]|nr:glycoside hydrolase family 43 protein [Clostridia bacterium]
MDNQTQLLIEQRADPFVCRHRDGYYYFTASVPSFDRIELRRAATLDGLKSAPAKAVWRRRGSGPMSRNIWAPEIHFMDDAWYIYFAASQDDADADGCYDHRIYVLENKAANPLEGMFTVMGRVDTGWSSFSLDATTFTHRGRRYLVWAQRDAAIAGNSNLYIAEMENPRTLRLPAVLLSKPEYSWECQGFLVNEGPAVLARNGLVFITYSASATDERYCMGLLTADENADLLNPASWMKSSDPVMGTDGVNGLYGPGHNSFTVDARGGDMLVFHARPYPGFQGTALSDPNRHTFLRPLTYDAAGRPLFQ